MKKILLLFMILSVALFVFGCGSKGAPEEINGQPRIAPVDDPPYNNELYYYAGEVTDENVLIEYTTRDRCTLEELNNFYICDLKDKDYEHAIIYYTDKPGYGVYAAGKVITKDVKIEYGLPLDTDETAVYECINGKIVPFEH